MKRDEIEHQLAIARQMELDPAADKGSLRGQITALSGIVRMLLEELGRKPKK